MFFGLPALRWKVDVVFYVFYLQIERKMKGGRLTAVQWDTINFDELNKAGLAAVQEQRYRPGTAARSNEAFRAYKTFITNCPSALEKNDGKLLPIQEHTMRSFLTFVRTVLVSLLVRLFLTAAVDPSDGVPRRKTARCGVLSWTSPNV